MHVCVGVRKKVSLNILVAGRDRKAMYIAPWTDLQLTDHQQLVAS
jgi:hypothetical protein